MVGLACTTIWRAIFPPNAKGCCKAAVFDVDFSRTEDAIGRSSVNSKPILLIDESGP
jgi:hypothetical protein